MRRTALLCTFVFLLSMSRIAAQEPGQRVRVRIDSAPSRWVVGTLVARDQDTLRLLVLGDARPISLARSAVRRLEISGGRSRAIVEGASAGFGLGFIVGAYAEGRRESSSGCPDGLLGLCIFDMEANVTQTGVVAGVLGGVAGGAVGFAVRSERWKRVNER